MLAPKRALKENQIKTPCHIIIALLMPKMSYTSELISNNGENIFIIADGMGGYSGGDYASNYLIREIYRQFANNKNFNITKSLNSIDDELIEISKNDHTKSGMGTTVVSAIIQSNNVKVFNVGDSSLFHITNKSIEKISIILMIIYQDINL